MRIMRILASLLFAAGSMSIAHAGSSNSLMDVSSDGTRLLVANTDSGTVTVVDLEKRAKLHEIPESMSASWLIWVVRKFVVAYSKEVGLRFKQDRR